MCMLIVVLSGHSRDACLFKPGSHMPPTYLGHSLGQRCGICEHLSPTQSVPGNDRRLACEVELSSTSQASRRLSAMKIFYVNIICGDLRRYAATKSHVGRRHMRTRLKCQLNRGVRLILVGCTENLGLVVQSPLTLTKDLREF